MKLPSNPWETFVYSTCFNLTIGRGIAISNNLLTIREPLQLALYLLLNKEQLHTFQKLDLKKARKHTSPEIFQLIPNLFPEGSTQRIQEVLKGSSLLTYPDDFGFSIVAQIDAFLTPENAKLLDKLGLDAEDVHYCAKLLEIVYSVMFWFLHDLPKDDSLWEALDAYSIEKEAEYGPLINIMNGEVSNVQVDLAEEDQEEDQEEDDEFLAEFESFLMDLELGLYDESEEEEPGELDDSDFLEDSEKN